MTEKSSDNRHVQISNPARSHLAVFISSMSPSSSQSTGNHQQSPGSLNSNNGFRNLTFTAMVNGEQCCNFQQSTMAWTAKQQAAVFDSDNQEPTTDNGSNPNRRPIMAMAIDGDRRPVMCEYSVSNNVNDGKSQSKQ
ncbi:hypothetical protein ACLOJK_033998 [Asimina triloba]